MSLRFVARRSRHRRGQLVTLPTTITQPDCQTPLCTSIRLTMKSTVQQKALCVLALLAVVAPLQFAACQSVGRPFILACMCSCYGCNSSQLVSIHLMLPSQHRLMGLSAGNSSARSLKTTVGAAAAAQQAAAAAAGETMSTIVLSARRHGFAIMALYSCRLATNKETWGTSCLLLLLARQRQCTYMLCCALKGVPHACSRSRRHHRWGGGSGCSSSRAAGSRSSGG